MRPIIPLLHVGLALATFATGMTAFAADSVDYDVVRISEVSRHAGQYRPGQIIVKFTDTSRANIDTRRAPHAGVSAIDRVFSAIGVSKVESLMPLSANEQTVRAVKGFNGRPVPVRSMAKAYLLDVSADVPDAISQLASLPDVEFAEPNYLVYALGDETPDDPYYSQQWGLQDINMPALWGEPVISKDGPVIAIIDTGVDITHPDLAANIWTNPREGAGVDGYDDDANGFVDDLHGWDFVNNTGVMVDYNGHGTHCAGIAAACGFNSLGIIGANPYARIMPISVLQSNGTGDIATIIRGIDYATANGADIISMSLGTYSESAALEQALGRAYQKSIIVAAAGNDGYCLNHKHLERGQFSPRPMFPAAYTFVLGVQASTSTGSLASFSNYDDDGAIYSPYSEEKLYNYELTAPGASIISTFPNGQYKSLNGTSMATPLVAGALSRLLMAKEYPNREELFGDLINSVTSKGLLDIHAAYLKSDKDRRPSLQMITYDMEDTDGDGRADAGETIKIYPKLRNAWGVAKNIRYTIEVAETANTFCKIASGKNVEFGSVLNSYASSRAINPVEITFNPDVVDGRVCRFRLTATCDRLNTPLEQEFELTVENGVEIGGVIAEDMTLHAGVHYIVTTSLAVPEGVTLTIEPGAVIRFKKNRGLIIAGNLIADGKPGNMITFTSANSSEPIATLNFMQNSVSYCIFENLHNGGIIISDINAKKCLFRNVQSYFPIYENTFEHEKISFSNIYDVVAFNMQPMGIYNNCNVIKLTSNCNNERQSLQGKNISNSNIYNNYYHGDIDGLIVTKIYSLSHYAEIPNTYIPEHPNYLGTSVKKTAENRVLDIHWPGSASFGEYSLDNMLTRPVAEAPGIVWKVMVDGYDAQDEYDMLPPLGVGRHKFEVYFNRPMDKSVAPTIAMGVRPPYTQTAIGEDGTWNDVGDVYTAYLTINGKQKIDGVNRIYVSGARDNEYFDIPVEDVRFNVNVQATGALSSGFFGEPGLGCVKLQWEDMDMNFDDIMGYNLYRSTAEGDTIRLNEHLIESGVTSFTDYDVKTGTTYLYHYTVMTTSLTENEPSKTIAVTPLTAEMGDANGSGAVDINDILTTVNYIGGEDPKPFIFDAADMNSDTDINILDVVGIVQTVIGGEPQQVASAAQPETAYFWVEDGMLYLTTREAVGGIQVHIKADRKNSQIIPGPALAGLESMGAWVADDSEYILLSFSMNGRSIAPGTHAILQVGDMAEVVRIVLGDTSSSPREIPIEKLQGTSNILEPGVDIAGPAYSQGIYNVVGVKLADDISALESLPAGFYIVNGEKIIKK